MFGMRGFDHGERGHEHGHWAGGRHGHHRGGGFGFRRARALGRVRDCGLYVSRRQHHRAICADRASDAAAAFDLLVARMLARLAATGFSRRRDRDFSEDLSGGVAWDECRHARRGRHRLCGRIAASFSCQLLRRATRPFTRLPANITCDEREKRSIASAWARLSAPCRHRNGRALSSFLPDEIAALISRSMSY